MPDIEKESADAAKKKIHIYYIIDTSGSLKGISIAQINSAIKEHLDVFGELVKKNEDMLIKTEILSYNNSCEWVAEIDPEELEDFIWNDLSTGELSDIGPALTELNNKLSGEYLSGTLTEEDLPVFVFMTDGLTTDDYSKPLDELKQKEWFDKALKIGFELGNDVDMNVITDIVGNKDNILKLKDITKFARLIKDVQASKTINQ